LNDADSQDALMRLQPVVHGSTLRMGNNEIYINRLFIKALLVAFLALMFGVSTSYADDLIPKDARNCDVLQPPKESGDSVLNGRLMKVFPRRKHMAANYTGCQTIWLDIQRMHKLERILVLYFENDEIKVQQHMEAGRSFSCRYHADSLLPNSCPECSKKAIGSLSSSPAGCAKSSLRDEKQHAVNCDEVD
jgi:hypothetical protein